MADPAPTATTYTVHVQEFAKDRTTLKASKYQLQVAKTVKDDKGIEDANIVYKSFDLAPNMTVEWVEEYALNWTLDLSKPGVKVTYAGDWEPAKLGDSFNIDDTGTFIKDTTAQGDKKALNISKNGYPNGIYMILGIKDDKAYGGFTPIYVSPSELVVQGAGSYIPIQKVQIWFQSEDLTATGIAKQRSYVEKYDMVDERERYFWLPLEYGSKDKRGKWLNDEKRFPKPADSSNNISVRALGVATNNSVVTDEDTTGVSEAMNPIMRVTHKIRFSPAVEKSLRIALGSYTAAKISQILRNVSNVTVKFEKSGNDGEHATAEWDKAAPPPPADTVLIAEEAEDDKEALDQALKDAKKEGKMGKDETWSIDP